MSPNNPLQFRKSQDFYITSQIELNCNDSLSFISQWAIYNCTTTMNCSFPIQIDPIVQTTFSELYIPARILPYGFYRFQLTIAMSKYPTITKSSFTYVSITATGIVTNIAQYGTSMITRGHSQDLTLNPGTFSTDLDDNIFNSTVISSLILIILSIFLNLGLDIPILLSNLYALQFSTCQWRSIDN